MLTRCIAIAPTSFGASATQRHIIWLRNIHIAREPDPRILENVKEGGKSLLNTSRHDARAFNSFGPPRSNKPMANESAPVASTTRYYTLDLLKTNIFGQPRIEITRLEAAMRRVVEHFVVYDAIEQALLEYNEVNEYGSKNTLSAEFRNDLALNIDYRALAQLQPDQIASVRSYLFNNYTVLKSSNFTDFVDQRDSLPMQPALSKDELSSRLNALLEDDRPILLKELLWLFSMRGEPRVDRLLELVGRLVKQRYIKPAQVILDSLIMSRIQLNPSTLALCLRVAIARRNTQLFTQYARLVKLPTDIKPNEISSTQNFGVDAKLTPFDVKMQKRLGLEQLPTPSSVYLELARGYCLFHDPARLDRVSAAAQRTGNLTPAIVTVLLRAAIEYSDVKRADWVWGHSQNALTPTVLAVAFRLPQLKKRVLDKIHHMPTWQRDDLQLSLRNLHQEWSEDTKDSAHDLLNAIGLMTPNSTLKHQGN